MIASESRLSTDVSAVIAYRAEKEYFARPSLYRFILADRANRVAISRFRAASHVQSPARPSEYYLRYYLLVDSFVVNPAVLDEFVLTAARAYVAYINTRSDLMNSILFEVRLRRVLSGPIERLDIPETPSRSDHRAREIPRSLRSRYSSGLFAPPHSPLPLLSSRGLGRRSALRDPMLVALDALFIAFRTYGRNPRPLNQSALNRTLRMFTARFYSMLSEQERGSLNQFLLELSHMPDFFNENRRGAVLGRIREMLLGIQTNQEFREQVNRIIEDALSSCIDRVIIAFNRIEIQWRILCGTTRLDDRALANLVLGIERLHIIERYARQKIRLIMIDQPQFEEDLEVILALQFALADVFNLPISSRGMRFPVCAQVNRYDIQEAARLVRSNTQSLEQQVQILSESEYWKARLEETHASLFQELSDRYARELEMIDVQTVPDQVYRAHGDAIATRRQLAIQRLVVRLTRAQLVEWDLTQTH